MSPQVPYHKLLGKDIKRGRPSFGSKPDKETLYRYYVKEGKSVREVALVLGCTKDMIHRAIKEYDILPRNNVARSKLRSYPKSEIINGIRKQGIRSYAKKLGVHENTLRNYYKSHLMGD